MPNLSRRSFLQQGATMVAAGWAVPSFIAETARVYEAGGAPTAHAAGRRILVIVQLAGGNDGLNTLVPYGDPIYYAPNVRPDLAISRSRVLPINGQVGLHPNLKRLKARYDRKQVAIVQGVGYPNQDRSHFRGTEIWESAVPDKFEPRGWAGRYLASCGCQESSHPEAIAVGQYDVPPTFWTEMSLVPALASVGSFRYFSVSNWNVRQRESEIQTLRNALAHAEGTPQAEFLRQSIVTALRDADTIGAADAYRAVGSYKEGDYFSNSMQQVAQLIAADVGTSIFYVTLYGFDTHTRQTGDHDNLMEQLDTGIDAFLQDMEAINRIGDVTIMTFSEFGRRLAQNDSGSSAGTDHGLAAPMFLIGGSVNGGLHGTHPSLGNLYKGDLRMSVDFRSVYATVLNRWLQVTPGPILGGNFPPLRLFR